MSELKPANPAPKRRRHVSRKWHRWLGVITALPLLWLAVSGILLNHAESMGLNDRQVSASWVLKRYHQIPEGKPRGAKVGDRLISTWGGEHFLDGVELPIPGTLIGAAAWKSKLVVATDERLAVINGAGEIEIELDELSLPLLPVEALSVENQQLAIQSGGGVYRFSDDLLNFEKVVVSSLAPPLQLLEGTDEKSLKNSIQSRNAMPLSRVILDAHSGKLFGWPGWLITDLSAVSIVILTLIGLRLFPKKKS